MTHGKEAENAIARETILYVSDRETFSGLIFAHSKYGLRGGQYKKSYTSDSDGIHHAFSRCCRAPLPGWRAIEP